MDADIIWILVVVVVGFLGFIIWHFDIASRVFVKSYVYFLSKEEARDFVINDWIPDLNKDCPEDQGDGIVFSRVYMEGDYIVYRFELDGEKATIEAMREIDEADVNQIKTDQINEFAKQGTNSLYIKAEYGVINEYVEKGSDEKFIIKEEYTELDV